MFATPPSALFALMVYVCKKDVTHRRARTERVTGRSVGSKTAANCEGAKNAIKNNAARKKRVIARLME